MCKYAKMTDEELIACLRSDGKDEITDYLMEKYKTLVRKKANAMYLIGGETEDLIQEGMIGLFKALRDFQPERETRFSSFAGMCIERQMQSAITASNRKKNQPLNSYISIFTDSGEEGMTLEEILPDEQLNPEKLVIEQEFKKKFWEMLEKELSYMEREVLRQYLNGYGYVKIAKIMEKEPKSIDNALQRIRKKIRELDEKVGD